MKHYNELVFKIVYFENTDVVTTSDTLAGKDNVVGALDSWGDGWKGMEG